MGRGFGRQNEVKVEEIKRFELPLTLNKSFRFDLTNKAIKVHNVSGFS